MADLLDRLHAMLDDFEQFQLDDAADDYTSLRSQWEDVLGKCQQRNEEGAPSDEDRSPSALQVRVLYRGAPTVPPKVYHPIMRDDGESLEGEQYFNLRRKHLRTGNTRAKLSFKPVCIAAFVTSALLSALTKALDWEVASVRTRRDKRQQEWC
ncbi:hypothetical protein CYLTODRAFT_409846 [Cylindrobasidium torrendii FP15055 ss-10]|uniref:Uncharacterized protein n=1 Tax=Cylindrobasidium torrendii FP15055 ss-10 TaxID=1314674 RepID=A0A0D7BF84_9AGAR|nr:hypothetical protein CYLTODRAFT_409846 [Cylindrobasidium torrendii FP15055 ss-10]